MNAYEIKQAARKQRLEDRAARLAHEAEATHKQAREMASHIPFGQPILVGHHSEGRDRNYRKRIRGKFEKAFDTDRLAGEVAARAEAVGTAGISSDDPDATAKLRAELAEVEAAQAKMTQANRLVRKKDTAGLAAMGYSPRTIENLLMPDQLGRVGFADFQLANNSANMRRIRLRIESLVAAAARPAAPNITGPGYVCREDKDDNRLLFVFDGKPTATTIKLLKSSAFKWSPTRTAWVRQLNNAARYAAKYVCDQMAKG